MRPVERVLYRLTGVDEDHEMRWTEYAAAMLLFSLVSMLLLYLIAADAGTLPLNPQKFGAGAGSTWRSTRRRRLPRIPTGRTTVARPR